MIKVNPLDINHIENSQCGLGWRCTYMGQVCTWRFFTSRVIIFFLILTQIYRLGVIKEDDVLPCKKGTKKKMKYHNSKGNKWIDNISQGHPVDIALKWKLNAPATHKKSSVFGYRNYSGLIFCWIVKRFNNRFCQERTAIPSRIFKTRQTHITTTVGHFS